jgi:hypothetical protein
MAIRDRTERPLLKERNRLPNVSLDYYRLSNKSVEI